ncbi:MAG: GDSL-type esterase/lipase family protein [Planctomycetota bacterium]
MEASTDPVAVSSVSGRRARRGLGVAGLLLLSALALEGTLQVLAFGASIVYAEKRQLPASSGSEVLCIGDSYTFGVGASDPEHSYPGQLQSALGNRSIDIAVRNGGWPGQNSRDVLLKLQSQLQMKPRVVCVLLGTNDSWSRPDALAPEDPRIRAGASTESGRFVWRWRTLRLIEWLFGTHRGDWTSTGPAPEPQQNETDSAGSQLAVEQSRRECGFGLLVSAGIDLDEVHKDTGGPACPPEVRDAVNSGWKLIESGRPADAYAELSAARQEHPGIPALLGVLINAATRAGRSEEVPALVKELEDIHAASPSDASTEPLLRALALSGRTQEAMDLARECTRHSPLMLSGWEVLQQSAFTLGDWAEAQRAMPVVLGFLGRTRPSWSASIVRNLARATKAEDPRRTARLMVGATLIDGDIALSRVALQALAKQLPRASMDAALAESGVAPTDDVAHRLLDLLDEVYGGVVHDSWRRVLRNNLITIGRIAKQAGARVVFVSYPFFNPVLEEEQRAAADELGAPYVLVRERFDAELKTHKREELFVKDGHCNDAGYAIVAQLVAERVAELLQAK